MPKRYLVSMTASNRPGVLAVITNSLSELGGNTLELKQSLVFGHLSLLASIDFPDHRNENVIVEHLVSAGQAFELDVKLKSLSLETKERVPNEAYRSFLIIHGNDSPGVIRKFCSLLGRELIDIQDFYGVGDQESKTFSMAAELLIPTRTDYNRIEEDLQSLASKNNLEISLHQVKDEDRNTSTRWPQNVNLLVEKMQKSE